MVEEKSAGGVVYRKSDGMYLIGKHSGYHKWVLPKGLIEEGESATEAALREVMEEVGVEAKIMSENPVKVIEYEYFADLAEVKNKNPHTESTVRRVGKYQEEGGGETKIHKIVTYYLMELEADLGNAGWEMEERKWVSYEEGMSMLSFESEKEVFVAANKVLCAPDQN